MVLVKTALSVIGLVHYMGRIDLRGASYTQGLRGHCRIKMIIL